MVKHFISFRNEFNKINNIGARMLDSIYQIKDFAIYTRRCNGSRYKTLGKYFIDFNTCLDLFSTARLINSIIREAFFMFVEL